jgi:hypothetical protein
MPRWKMFFPVFIVTFALGTFGSPRKHHDVKKTDTSDLKVNRKDPAFVAGYDEGYRQGANDSHASANYSDQSGPFYEQATNGYTTLYGDKQIYQQRFRVGYIDGYKAGWDLNAGMYSPLGGKNR